MLKPLFFSAISCLLLGACSAATPPQPTPVAGPQLRLEQYFDGPLQADGLVFNRGGKLIKSFHVSMVGSWSGDHGTLVEDYLYSDGQSERRVWALQRLVDANGRVSYRGSAPDVVGEPEGQAEGNSFQWRYQLLLPLFGHRIAIDMDDAMFLVDDKVLLNRTQMRKFGFDVGSVFITMRKP